jgi:RND family efflux transporter MFP subunit
MHPNYTSDRPGDCPICNMKLVPQQANDATAGAGHDSTAMHGMVVLDLDEQSRKLAGIQTTPAVHEAIAHAIRTVGTVLPDEGRIRHEHTRIQGYVEKLFVNATGQFVQAGDRLLAIYSPELLATQEEFLRAREAATRFANSDLPEVRRGAEDLVAAARQRLTLFEVPESFLLELERTGVAQRTITLLATATGHVTEKFVREGQQVEPGQVLYTVTDLSRVWVDANFYENEARLVKVGQTANLTLPYDGAQSLQGAVSYVYPFLDPDTRTLRVRFEFANPKLQLKPAMYVDVTLQIETPPAVLVPESAILDSGLRRLVFVEVKPNRFEPREVVVGLRSDARAEILSGLAPGEVVVVRANFLLDSESRLRASISGAAASEREGHTP